MYTSMHHDPQGNTHSQADVRTPACITTHRATHTARQTYVHQHASRPTGARQYTSMHDDPQGNQADIRTPACITTHRQTYVHQHASRPTGQHTEPGRRTPACITTHRATHTARQMYVHQHASRPTGQHTQPGRHTYTSMHYDPQGNTHSQADICTPEGRIFYIQLL